MRKYLDQFVSGLFGHNDVQDESGAVTVDWVVLTAAIIVFGLVAWTIIQGGIQQGASDIRAAILSTIA